MNNETRQGFWYIAPEDDPKNHFAAGADGNRFETKHEAECVAEHLSQQPGFECVWVVQWREE